METHIQSIKHDAGPRALANAEQSLANIETALAYSASWIAQGRARLEDYLAYLRKLLSDPTPKPISAPAWKDGDGGVDTGAADEVEDLDAEFLTDADVA